MEWIRFSFRNLFRHKRRTIINLLSIGFAVGFIIIFDIIISGQKSEIIRNSVGYGIGDIKIYKKGYDKESLRHPLDLLINNPEEIINKIKNIPHIEGISPRLVSGGIFSTGEKQAPVFLYGIDPSREFDVSVFQKVIKEGKNIKKDTYSAIIGNRLANDLELNINNLAFIYGRTKKGANNLVDVNISGIYKTGYSKIDEKIVLIPIDVARSLFDTKGTSEIVVILDKDSYAKEIRDSISVKLDGMDVEVFDYAHFIPEIQNMMATQQGMMTIFRAVLLIIAIIGIINAMLMNIWERKKEIGTLRAIGYQKTETLRIFFLESLWLGIIGSIIGCGIALITGLYLELHGIVVPAASLEGLNIPIGNVMKGKMAFHQFVNGSLLGIIATLIAGIIPTLKAGNINIIDSLREY